MENLERATAENESAASRPAEPNPGRASVLEPVPEPTRRMPIGAEVLRDGGAHFRVWAPRARAVSVQLISAKSPEPISIIALAPEPNHYFSGATKEAAVGMRYWFNLDSGRFPDPASRFQPEGPHGPSEIVDPARFDWSDSAWRGLAPARQVLYEMHVGTFTREGMWRSAAEQLPELARLGITAVELMPVADFPGRFGWGYDGVNLFAPSRLYGLPDDFRAFVNRAHKTGLGVILDVVYNHFGPDGNYLPQFSADYATDRYPNEWGQAINFDGANCGPVREFFLSNAAYWIDEFHLDGLRLDATQQIFDNSESHIIAEVAARVRATARPRSTLVIAEDETQHARKARPAEQDGFGLDALWNDDFHHSAMVALTGHSEAYYRDYRGRPQEFISAVKCGYLYQGQWSGWQGKRRGAPALDLHPRQFINFIQNHDQVANSLHGSRMHQVANPALCRALSALLLLGPGTPMLFQGQEFAASSPFLYFADHKPDLARGIARGRRQFLIQFPSVAGSESCLADPAGEQTFLRCKLDFAERDAHASWYQFHGDLLQLRRDDAVFNLGAGRHVDGAVLGFDAFVLRFFGATGQERLLLVNLGSDLVLDAAPEPLLAPPAGHHWRTLWSSEDPRYGGSGVRRPEADNSWVIPGASAVVMTTITPSA